MAKRKVSNYKTDRRRKHHHWLVTVTYADNESFDERDLFKHVALELSIRVSATVRVPIVTRCADPAPFTLDNGHCQLDVGRVVLVG